MKLVYIAGSSHSGSTLLDMLLSCHSGIIGLGEVHQMVTGELRASQLVKGQICSCGKPLDACPVWREFLAAPATGSNEFVENYRRLLRIIHQHFGKVMVSDSSKYLPPLQSLWRHAAELQLKPANIRVIHLIKDARAYVYSQKKLAKTSAMGERSHFNCWLKDNHALERFLTKNNIPTFRIGYEELCFYPEFILRRICEFLGVAFEASLLDMSQSRAHIGLGNPMRHHPVKSRGILYDCRWLLDGRIGTNYLLMPNVRKANHKWVYGNTADSLRSGRHFEPPAPSAP